MKKRKLRKNKPKILSLFLVFLIVALIGILFLFLAKGLQSYAKSNKTKISTATEQASQNSDKQVIYPTIYITGSGGDVSSINRLVTQLLPMAKAGDKPLILMSDVKKNYELKVEGEISKNTQYPMIEFGTVAKTDSGTLFSEGLQKAISYLAEHYQVPWINLVGYSSGATGAIYYMIDTADKANFPPVNKYFSLEGEYNDVTNLVLGETLTDVLKNGPLVKTAMYKYIADNYQKISSKTQMMLLEGDFDTDKQTDSAIPWADSFSIYHLFKKNGNEIAATLYPTKLRHSKAPTNPTVAKYVKNFIYGSQ